MVKRWAKVGVVLVVVAMFASSGWCQERRGQRGFGFMRPGQQGQYISAVLLLGKATSAKVEAVYEEEGQKSMEAMREIFQAAGGDREGAREKMQQEREKSAERIKAALKEILSEEQLKGIEPILTASTGFRSGYQDAHLLALASLELTGDQRGRLVKLNLPYAKSVRSLPRPGRDATEADRTEWQEKLGKIREDFQKSVRNILSAEQEENWGKEVAKLQEQWESERQERRQRMGERGGGQRPTRQ